MIFEGHAGGVTQVKFISDGNTLLTGARKVSKRSLQSVCLSV